LLPTLSFLSVNTVPVSCLRFWCSFKYLRIAPLHLKFRLPLPDSRMIVSSTNAKLSFGLSYRTYQTTYKRFTPSDSGQCLGLSYYRGCWHEICRPLFLKYSHYAPSEKKFTTFRPSSFTRRRSIRLSPIVEDSSLLPPVGVWTVSQFHCGWPSSQTSYPSSPWWAITPPTS